MSHIGRGQHNLTAILHTMLEPDEVVARRMTFDIHNVVLNNGKKGEDKTVQVRHERWKNFNSH